MKKKGNRRYRMSLLSLCLMLVLSFTVPVQAADENACGTVVEESVTETPAADSEAAAEAEEPAESDAAAETEESAVPDAAAEAEEPAVPEAAAEAEESVVPEAAAEAEESVVPEAAAEAEEPAVLDAAGDDGENAEEDESEDGIIMLALEEGNSSEACDYNLKALNAAFLQAGEAGPITVKIKEAGKTYYVGTETARSLRICSDVTLDLNGCTLVRSGSMANMLQNVDFNDERDTGDYELSENIVIQNGTLDGSGGDTGAYNLVNIGHATGVTFSNVNFKNCRGGHLLEFSGCQNCMVENCTFTGYSQGSTNEPGEAIQLDCSVETWNGAFTCDGTVCKDITVTGCSFLDYPSGVGNHHALTGTAKCSGIKITNNTFTNTASATAPAIWVYGFTGSVISNNTITGNYTWGVQVSGGSNTVSGNIIGSAASPVNYPGVTVTTANCDVLDGAKPAGNSERVSEPASNCQITGNKIYTKGSTNYPVAVFAGSKATKVSNNTLSSASIGIIISGKGSYVSEISGNNVKTTNLGIAVASSGSVGNLYSNTINSKGIGLSIAGSTAAKNIGASGKGNKITSSADSGVYIANSAVVSGSIAGNSITKCKKLGLYINNSCTVKGSISGNTITGNTGDALRINTKSTVTGDISGNTITCGSSSAHAILVNTGCAVKGSIKSNTITGGSSYACIDIEAGTANLASNKLSKGKYGIYLQKGVKATVNVNSYVGLGSKSIAVKTSSGLTTLAGISAVTLKSFTSSKKATAVAAWTKLSGSSKYILQYATNKNFSGAVTKTLTSSTSSLTLTKLKSGTTYYVRIRSVRTVGTATIYGSYSSVKTVKVK